MAEKPTHVMIDRETLEILRDVASAAVTELEDGIADGTYDDANIGGHTSAAINDAIETADAVMA